MVKPSERLLTLDVVKAHFCSWREQRRHQREAIPESLWREVALLCSRYSASDIARELRLKPQQMREKIDSLKPSSAQFIGLSLAAAPDSFQPVSSLNYKAELIHPNGLCLRFKTMSEIEFERLLTLMTDY